MKIFVTGANFTNKGAQSMLFTTVSEIRRRYPDAEIFFAHADNFPALNGKFNFTEIYYHKHMFEVSENEIVCRSSVPKSVIEQTFDAIKDSDLIIDISGFSLGRKWGVKTSLGYLNTIKVAQALRVPIILFPQSFGDFEFGEAQKLLDAEIKSVMTYPEKIFARERDGYIPLVEHYGLKNVSLHPDLVLSAPNVELADIYKTAPKISVPKVAEDSCVGVVPNIRSFDKGNPWQTLQVFYETINFLLREKKHVYLFRHSREDIVPCKWLKALFADEGRVTLWENDFSCFEYDKVCRQFEFLIVGRFHGIVHAYKNNVPCILFGWAVKYRELAQLMYQQRYIFDITAPNLDTRNILSAIRDMENNAELNRKILRERLAQVQANSSCFDAAIKILGRRSS